MKNIQVIDSADNCTYDIYAASDVDFRILFPGDGQDVEFIDDVIDRTSEESLLPVLRRLWKNRVKKVEVQGIHGTLFYELEFKKEFYPTKRESEMITGYPKPLSDHDSNDDG